MIYVTSDLHGKFNSLQQLLEKVSFSSADWLYIIGDVVDRNDKGGVDILRWLLFQPNVELLMGNHEDFLLANAWLFEEVNEDSIRALDSRKLSSLDVWKRNGGGVTIETLQKLSPETRADILEYLRDCKLYESVSVNGRDFLLVHGGLGNYSADKKITDYTPVELIWERPTMITRYSDRFTTILGHTPTLCYGNQYRGKILKTDTWINVDTGAAAGLDPCLLRLDDMQEFYL